MVRGVLPHMHKELSVRDELSNLRVSLFSLGVIVVVTNILALGAIFYCFFGGECARYAYGTILGILNGLGGILLATILYFIYNNKSTKE